MSVTITPIYFKIDNLFNQVMMQSQYRAKSIRAESGATQDDEVGIHEGDRPIVDKFIKQATKDVFKWLGFLSKGLDAVEETDDLDVDYKGYEWGVTFETSEGSNVDNCVVFRFILPEEFYSDMLPIFEEKIEETIVNKALERWYYNKRMGEDAKLHGQYSEQLRQEMRSRAFFKRNAPSKRYNIL